MLEEARMSVVLQTTAPVVHLVETTVCSSDDGPGPMRNRLIEQAILEYDCDWIALLDDDDLLDPEHLEVLTAAAEANPDAALIYPDCRVTLDNVEVDRRKFWRQREWDPVAIQRHNWIPVTVLLNVKAWGRHGGFPRAACEDWELWKKFAAAGEQVVYVDQVTWTYRDPSWLDEWRRQSALR